MNITFLELRSICAEAGFRCRGTAFFRVQNDSVLQVLKYSKKETPFYSEIVNVGLFSMFSELKPQWLTSSGCIPLYNCRYITAPRWELEQNYHKARVKTIALSEDVLMFHIHLNDIASHTLPFLSEIGSQKALIDGIDYLEYRSRLHKPGCPGDAARWTDINKFAPYLYEKEYDKALRIILTLLRLYGVAELERNLSELDPRAEALRQKALLVKSGNDTEIHDYLLSNYEKNKKLAAFCMKHGAVQNH